MREPTPDEPQLGIFLENEETETARLKVYTVSIRQVLPSGQRLSVYAHIPAEDFWRLVHLGGVSLCRAEHRLNEPVKYD